MGTKTIIYYFLLSLAFIFSSSCKKRKNATFGQYSVAISYDGVDALPLQLFIDGRKDGDLLVMPNLTPTYVEDCDDLDNPNELTNVFVIKQIISGKHRVEVKNSSGYLLRVLEFEMQNNECVFQSLDIVVD